MESCVSARLWGDSTELGGGFGATAREAARGCTCCSVPPLNSRSCAVPRGLAGLGVACSKSRQLQICHCQRCQRPSHSADLAPDTADTKQWQPA